MTQSADPARASGGTSRTTRSCAVALPQVPRWHLASLLHAGRYCDVFTAVADGSRQIDRHPRHLVKLLREEHEKNPALVAAMCREAEIGQQVQSPHLVSVLDVNIDQPPYFAVMPFLSGSSVAMTLATVGQLEVADAVWICRQVADALVALHAGGWIHGDVKPANILVGLDGHATLLDLGFSGRVDIFRKEEQQFVQGTPAYLAPEAWLNRANCEFRSDLYSLGVTLYEMLVGNCPFEGENLDKMAKEHFFTRPQDPRSANPNIPSELARLVQQMLSKHSFRRPADAETVVKHLINCEILLMTSLPAT